MRPDLASCTTCDGNGCEYSCGRRLRGGCRNKTGNPDEMHRVCRTCGGSGRKPVDRSQPAAEPEEDLEPVFEVCAPGSAIDQIVRALRFHPGARVQTNIFTGDWEEMEADGINTPEHWEGLSSAQTEHFRVVAP